MMVLRIGRKTARTTRDAAAQGRSQGLNRGDGPASSGHRSIAAPGVPSLGRGGAVTGRHSDLSHVAPLDGPKAQRVNAVALQV